MKIRLSQLRKLIREAVQEELAAKEVDEVDQVDELDEAEASLDEYDGSYSRGGEGGNRWGDSWDVPKSDTKPWYEMTAAEREREKRLEKEREEYYGRHSKEDDDRMMASGG